MKREGAEGRQVWSVQEVNLLGWLQEREQQSGGAPVGSPKPAALGPDTDSSVPKHQQAAEVWPHSPLSACADTCTWPDHTAFVACAAGRPRSCLHGLFADPRRCH